MRSKFGLYCLMTGCIMANESWWSLLKTKCTQYSICVRGQQLGTGHSKEPPLALPKHVNFSISIVATIPCFGTKKWSCPTLNCLFSNKHLLVFTIKISLNGRRWVAKFRLPRFFFPHLVEDILISVFQVIWLYTWKTQTSMITKLH